jgi:hypothetical protein
MLEVLRITVDTIRFLYSLSVAVFILKMLIFSEMRKDPDAMLKCLLWPFTKLIKKRRLRAVSGIVTVCFSIFFVGAAVSDSYRLAALSESFLWAGMITGIMMSSTLDLYSAEYTKE